MSWWIYKDNMYNLDTFREIRIVDNTITLYYISTQLDAYNPTNGYNRSYTKINFESKKEMKKELEKIKELMANTKLRKKIDELRQMILYLPVYKAAESDFVEKSK